jgi:hypothetical protein
MKASSGPDLDQSQSPFRVHQSDDFLSLVCIDERKDPLGAYPSQNKKRCNDKGLLAMADADHLEILDWLARNTVAGKRGSTPAEAPAIFERSGIDGVACSKVVKDFGRVFKNVAGKSTSIERAHSLKTGRKFYRARVYLIATSRTVGQRDRSMASVVRAART